MNRLLVILLIGGSILGAMVIRHYREGAAHQAELFAGQKSNWQREMEDLESRLELALQQARQARAPVIVHPEPSTSRVPGRRSSGEIMRDLRGLGTVTGSHSPENLRMAVYWLEELHQTGEESFPVIRAFLARYEDTELDISTFQGRRSPDPLPLEFAVPPSLRFGLFDVARRLGGLEGESILAESLSQTGRGVEVAYLARVLEAMAPGRYKELALNVAHTLLSESTSFTSTSALDRFHREHLFGVLTYFGDQSFARDAERQLVRADSQIDRGALNYLKESLGVQAVPIVEQAYQNPALTNSAGKEPLARLALNYVGTDSRADRFYEQTINDPLLTRSHRKNLIEDLNEDGFADPRNLTVNDLWVIRNRMALIERIGPEAMDDANAAAFAEAYKDLVNMQAKILASNQP